jgi:hypothetical protein
MLNSEAAQGFIEVEVSSAEFFARLTLDAREDGTRERHLGLARKAYDTARRFFPRADFSKATQNDLKKRLAEVRTKLEKSGESLA